MSKLCVEDRPDFLGNTIPASATDGSVLWIRLDNLPVMGRLVVLQRRNGMASNYDCAICNCPASLQSAGIETPASANLLPANTQQYTATAKYFDCNGWYSYYNVTTSATWSSSNTPVATVNNSGAKGLATAQSGGSATIHFSYNGYGYAPTGPPPSNCNSYPVCSIGDGGANVCDATISSGQSIIDGGTASFNVTPTGCTPTSYAWSFTAPQGAGNNPNVTFSPSNAASTTTNGRWFALPNGACTAATSAVYTIKATVTFPGNLQRMPQTTLTVSLLQTAGVEPPPYVLGYPAYAFNSSQNLWVVTGQGTLSRSVQSPIIYYSTSSQFYNKVVAHENKHVQQWTSGMTSDLYLVSSLMSQLSPLTDATENGLKAKISNTWNAWSVNQQAIHQSRHSAMEAEAYVVSDPIAPQYRYQSACGVEM